MKKIFYFFIIVINLKNLYIASNEEKINAAFDLWNTLGANPNATNKNIMNFTKCLKSVGYSHIEEMKNCFNKLMETYKKENK